MVWAQRSVMTCYCDSLAWCIAVRFCRLYEATRRRVSTPISAGQVMYLASRSIPLLSSSGSNHVQVCKSCGEEKPAGDFTRYRMRRDGLYNWCKACDIWKRQERRKRKRDEAYTMTGGMMQVSLLPWNGATCAHNIVPVSFAISVGS